MDNYTILQLYTPGAPSQDKQKQWNVQKESRFHGAVVERLFLPLDFDYLVCNGNTGEVIEYRIANSGIVTLRPELIDPNEGTIHRIAQKGWADDGLDDSIIGALP